MDLSDARVGVLPLLIFFCNALGAHVLSVSLPTLIQWHGHKAVESQDLGFFHDQFSGQVASRIAQVAGAVKQQMAAAVWTLPIFFVQMVGSVVLLTALSWPLTLPVLVWIAINGVIAKRMIVAGQVVSACQPVFTLAAAGEREVLISLPEQGFDRVKVGQPVEVELWSQAGERFPGRIRELAPSADPQSRTFAEASSSAIRSSVVALSSLSLIGRSVSQRPG